MNLKTKTLPPDVLQVVLNKGTERPFTGDYDQFDQPGSYLCRLCGLALFRAQSKFHSGCGWPSFDNDIPGTVKRTQDVDGMRTEITCARCDAHLGHVFEGEGFTPLNTRHCVNSVSLDFVSDTEVKDTEEAIFAGGCFWGVEHFLKQLPGVLKVESGYIGGNKQYPTYEEVCSGNTGHLEAVRVVFDIVKISYEAITKRFFEIHDPTQANGQGPDLGSQYLSAIFYFDDKQKETALDLIERLKQKGYDVVTQVLPVSVFWRAETYHQNYYTRTGKLPYCHGSGASFD